MVSFSQFHDFHPQIVIQIFSLTRNSPNYPLNFHQLIYLVLCSKKPYIQFFYYQIMQKKTKNIISQIQINFSIINVMQRSTSTFTNRLPLLNPKIEYEFPKTIKPKLDNHITIKPSSGYQKSIDYRFETDEEIQMEQYSHMLLNKKNQQKSKNSFQNYNPPNAQLQTLVQKKFTKTNNSKLDFFHCDSLIIRSHRNKNTSMSNITENSQLSKKRISFQLDHDSTAQASQHTFSRHSSKNDSSLANRSKPKNHRTSSIFKLKQKIANEQKQKQKQNPVIPFALEWTEPIKQIQIDNGFHIIFQADEITQCCF